ncbi:hypothetical protein ACFLVG_02285 [Chloroflexota bacterium]
MIEIRDCGDKQPLVVYTDQDDMYHKSGKSPKCTGVIFYHQQQMDRQVYSPVV